MWAHRQIATNEEGQVQWEQLMMEWRTPPPRALTAVPSDPTAPEDDVAPSMAEAAAFDAFAGAAARSR